MTTLPERLLARARKLEAVRDMLGIPACDYADQPHIDMLREAATALQPSVGGEVICTVDAHGGVSWRSERILPIGTPLYLASPAQPSGFVLVPVEPTEAMLLAEDSAIPDLETEADPFAWGRASWKAMLTAAPSAPIGQGG